AASREPTLRPRLLQLRVDGRTVVAYGLVGFRREREADRLVFADQDDLERASFRHAGERARTLADGQRARGVVPAHGDARERALFVAVRRAVVLIQRESAVGTGVDPQHDR